MEKNESKNMNEVDRLRKETHAAICQEWEANAPTEVRKGVPPSRIMAVIAARYGMTAQGVESVLRKGGVYDGAKSYKESVMGSGAVFTESFIGTSQGGER